MTSTAAEPRLTTRLLFSLSPLSLRFFGGVIMAGGKHDTDEGNPNPIPTPPPLAGDAPLSGEATSPPLPPPSARRPFTSLSQVDADLALARALQEQAPHHWTSSSSSSCSSMLESCYGVGNEGLGVLLMLAVGCRRGPTHC